MCFESTDNTLKYTELMNVTLKALCVIVKSAVRMLKWSSLKNHKIYMFRKVIKCNEIT